MGFILTLFSNRITWIVIAIAAVVMVMGVQQVRISHLKGVVIDRDAVIASARAEISSTKALVGQWRVSYKTLTATVITQNAAIARLEVEVAQRMARAKEAVRLADAARTKANGLAEAIQQMEIAKDECTGMRQLVDSYSSGRMQ